MSHWSDLSDELDAWAAAGRTATLWWRDDDAVTVTAALRELLAINARTCAPLALAVIPEAATTELGAAVLRCGSGIAVLQHGFAHRSHASDRRRKSELTSERSIDDLCAELRVGRSRLAERFGDRALPVMVPPWNRISPMVVPHLATWGYAGLSTESPRTTRRPSAGLIQSNVHVDLMRWRPVPELRAPEESVALLRSHLRRRRLGEVDGDEPTGILSHHLVLPVAGVGFLEELVTRVASHGAARWCTANEVFA